jgi:hypothetical protein
MRPEPTDEEMRRAWTRCKRETWPATFEEAMADPTLSRLVRITAMHPPRAHRVRAVEPVRPEPAQRPLPLPGIAPGYVDRKRAAAGDRDD